MFVKFSRSVTIQFVRRMAIELGRVRCDNEVKYRDSIVFRLKLRTGRDEAERNSMLVNENFDLGILQSELEVEFDEDVVIADIELIVEVVHRMPESLEFRLEKGGVEVKNTR